MLNISPLKESRKRNRKQAEPWNSSVEQAEMMELDETIPNKTCRAISELSIDELHIAQKMAKDRLKASLFVDIEIPAEPIGRGFEGKNATASPNMPSHRPAGLYQSLRTVSVLVSPSTLKDENTLSGTSFDIPDSPMKADKSVFPSEFSFMHPNPFQTQLLSPFRQPTARKAAIPPERTNSDAIFLENLFNAIIKNGNTTPADFASPLLSNRYQEFRSTLTTEKGIGAIGLDDTPDLVSVMIQVLKSFPSLISEQLYTSCQVPHIK
jgi:hypothetical protein